MNRGIVIEKIIIEIVSKLKFLCFVSSSVKKKTGILHRMSEMVRNLLSLNFLFSSFRQNKCVFIKLTLVFLFFFLFRVDSMTTASISAVRRRRKKPIANQRLRDDSNLFKKKLFLN